MTEDHDTYAPLPPAVADAASWQLATQLVRRHPDLLWVTTPIPFSGLYDLLDVRRLAKPHEHPAISFNRNGSAVSVSSFGDVRADGPVLRWQKALYLDDPRDWLIEVERAAGLTSATTGLSASTPSSLAVRWVSQFLWLHMAARERWTAWTDDRGKITPDDNPFARFPQASAWVRAHRTPSAQLLVYFVGPASRREPHFALTADGDLWAAGGEHHRLPEMHCSNGSITSLVTRTATEVLP